MKGFVLAAAVSLAAFFAAPAVAAQLKPPSCGLLSTAKLTRILHVGITSESNLDPFIPNQRTCSYSTATTSQDATIIYTTKAGKNVYTIEKTEAGKLAKAVPGVGGGAFWFTVSTGEGDGLEVGSQFPTDGPLREVDMLFGNIEARIDVYAPVTRVEALAKTVAAAL